MQKDRVTHFTLILFFLALIFVDAASLFTMQLLQNQTPSIFDVVTQPPSQQNLRRFENDLEDSSWLVQQLRPFVQTVRFSMLNDLGKKSVRGLDGWLFYDLDVRYLTERIDKSDAAEEEVVHSILSFRRRLSERGIQLLLVPAPGKPTIYPEELTRRATGMKAPINPWTRKIISRLESEGIQCIDLFTLFTSQKNDPQASLNPSYLIQDTHWSPHGMILAASSVASRLIDLGWTSRGTTDYIQKSISMSRLGDVLKMSKVPGIESVFKPEIVKAAQILHAADRKPYADDPASDILVLGDSFLRIYERDEPGSAGFVSHLACCLKKPLASIINDGGASTLVRQELYRKPGLLKGKKVVIWEFVERDLRFGTEGWQDIPLPEDPAKL